MCPSLPRRSPAKKKKKKCMTKVFVLHFPCCGGEAIIGLISINKEMPGGGPFEQQLKSSSTTCS
jgi:hypothetical protein